MFRNRIVLAWLWATVRFQFNNLATLISACPARVHIILRETFSMFYVVNKYSTLHFERFSSYRWHKNVSSSRYVIEYWITIDCNKFDCVLVILRRQPNWETISECQLRKRIGSWISIAPNVGISDFKNSTNYSMEYESKNSAQLER